ncbi:diacylglycerol/lipid kinase family protein [Benzoatithermus flavus]|uniref:Diacylglycerol kinase family protein n=1 Tax=Benzoatithermus flavus TaxID=3108223 RepID=A0ABU8XSA6_9PROT
MSEPARHAERRPAGLRVRALINSGSGTMLRLGVDRARAQLAGAFARRGVEVDLVFTEGESLRREAERALGDARAGRLDAVVVGGGDGSVNCVAGVLAGTGVPLGVLPLGTLNHFAKDLGMPQDLDAAVEAIVRSPPRAVDAAEVNGRVFVNNSLLGIYPYMVADRERRRKAHGLGKWAAMSLAFVRMLWRFPRRRLSICAEGWTRPYRTPCLFVGVNEYDFELFKVQRRVGMDKGELWLIVARHGHPLRFAWFAFRVAFRGLTGEDDFEVMRVSAAEVRAPVSRLRVATDGEISRMRTPLRYRILPRALQVLAPPAAAEV